MLAANKRLKVKESGILTKKGVKTPEGKNPLSLQSHF